jgi:calcineurin-like phosphoesterase family protein
LESVPPLTSRPAAFICPASSASGSAPFRLCNSPTAGARGVVKSLHGRKHLIAGNNDDAAVIGSGGWESNQVYAEVRVDGMDLVLCHYPFRTWRNMGKGWANLHGHSHSRLKPLPRQFDVGVEVWNFRPVQIAEVLGGMKAGTRKLT